jgi:hypothetical protein
MKAHVSAKPFNPSIEGRANTSLLIVWKRCLSHRPSAFPAHAGGSSRKGTSTPPTPLHSAAPLEHVAPCSAAALGSTSRRDGVGVAPARRQRPALARGGAGVQALALVQRPGLPGDGLRPGDGSGVGGGRERRAPTLGNQGRRSSCGQELAQQAGTPIVIDPIHGGLCACSCNASVTPQARRQAAGAEGSREAKGL